MKKIKKILAFIMVAVAVLGIIPATATTTYAANTSSSTMKIDSLEGTVTVKNAKGISKKVKSGSRLFSGDTVTTGDESAAYVLLDSSKAIKIDENSQVKIESKNKKLELTVVEGGIFFDVSKPLKKNESLNIRTSSMVCGVRGTIGVVEANGKNSSVYILEGKVAITGKYIDKKDDFYVSAGEIASVHAKATKQENTENYNSHVEKRKLTEKDIMPWVSKHIRASKKLTKRVKRATELDWEVIFLGGRGSLDNLGIFENSSTAKSLEDGLLINKKEDIALTFYLVSDTGYFLTTKNVKATVSSSNIEVIVADDYYDNGMGWIDGEYGADVAQVVEARSNPVSVKSVEIEEVKDLTSFSAVTVILTPSDNLWEYPEIWTHEIIGYSFEIKLGVTDLDNNGTAYIYIYAQTVDFR